MSSVAQYIVEADILVRVGRLLRIQDLDEFRRRHYVEERQIPSECGVKMVRLVVDITDPNQRVRKEESNSTLPARHNGGRQRHL